jgi:transcription initiation factor IIF auxiliary subunit
MSAPKTKPSATLKLAQDAVYQGDDEWRWSVWIKGGTAELDAIDHVVYTLHPSFPNPVRTVTDRSSNFKLFSSGWGAFTIFATVVRKSGRQKKLRHTLKLFYPAESE